MRNASDLPANPDLLLAATLFLMTLHARQPAQPVARAVVDHLERLMGFTELLSPRLLLALPRLREQWLSMAGRARPSVPARILPFRRRDR